MLEGYNMLVHPLSRTDEDIEDEHVPYVQSLHFLLTDAPFMDEVRHTFDTPSLQETTFQDQVLKPSSLSKKTS